MAATAKTRVMVFGTFDVVHQGHLSLFKQARRLAKNPYLIVSVARDLNVQRIKKHKALNSEKQRLKNVANSELVDRVVLGGTKNYLPHIVKERPSIIALGYDQKAYVKNLKQLLGKKGLAVRIIRLKAHKPHLYKSRFFK